VNQTRPEAAAAIDLGRVGKNPFMFCGALHRAS
jgi:hypothetical protein